MKQKVGELDHNRFAQWFLQNATYILDLSIE